MLVVVALVVRVVRVVALFRAAIGARRTLVVRFGRGLERRWLAKAKKVLARLHLLTQITPWQSSPAVSMRRIPPCQAGFAWLRRR